MTERPNEVAFDIDYPVVDHTTLRQICDDGRSLRISSTYLQPIMDEVVKLLTDRDRVVWPVLARAWSYSEPVDFGEKELVLEFDDGIVERLRAVRHRGFDLDLSKVYGAGGGRPVPAPVVLSALIDFLEESFRLRIRVGVLVD